MKNFNFKYPNINIYSGYTKHIERPFNKQIQRTGTGEFIDPLQHLYGKLFIRKEKNTFDDLVDSITGMVLSVHESAEIVEPERDLYVGRIDKYNVGRMVYVIYDAGGKFVLDDVTDFDIESNNKEYYGISASELAKLTETYGVDSSKHFTKNGSVNPQKCIKIILALNATDIVILSLPNYKYISLMSFLKSNGLVNAAGFADIKSLVGRKLVISAIKNTYKKPVDELEDKSQKNEIVHDSFNFTYEIEGLAVLKSKELKEVFPVEAIYYNPFIVEEAFDLIKAKAPAYIYGKKTEGKPKKVWEKDSVANPHGNNLNAKAHESLEEDTLINPVIDTLPF
jgi:hypothetical protein